MGIVKTADVNVKKTFKMLDVKARKFALASADAIATEAAKKTPMEYGDLLNSQYINVVNIDGIIQANVGYTADYAVYLNGEEGKPLPTWKPRPLSEKDGPLTNMNAEPGFLTNAKDPSFTRRIAAKFLSILSV